MAIKRLLSGLILLAALCGWFASPAAAATRPNILWIMSDDHAAHAVGAYGGRLAALNPTPNLDRLAREGVRLSNVFCVNSICTPSRATLLTGQYPHVNGVRTLNGTIEPARQHLPRFMKEAGYTTAMIGKWHLGKEPAAFDYYCVLPGQGWYFNPVFRRKGAGDWPNNTWQFRGYDSQHSSDAITQLSLRWLKDGRDKSRPFFLMHHFKAPHDNFENAERYDWLYADETIPEPESLWKVPNHGSKATAGTGTSVGKRNERRNMGHHMFVEPSLDAQAYQREAYQRYMKKYLRTVKGLDDNLGKLFDYLRETGELDNTVVLYTSDQGFMLGEHDYIDKRWMYEESLRMPFIVRYPATIEAGSVDDSIINNVDFAPTLLDFAGVEKPDFMVGRSFKPILEGEVLTDWRTATYYRYWMHLAHHDNPAHYGIRTKEHKLIFFYGLPLDAKGARPQPTIPGWELYDLGRDPHELDNVYDDPGYRAIGVELKAELLRLKQAVGDTDERYPELMKVRAQHWD